MNVLIFYLLVELLFCDEAPSYKLLPEVVLSFGRYHFVSQACQRRFALGYVAKVTRPTNPFEQAPL